MILIPIFIIILFLVFRKLLRIPHIGNLVGSQSGTIGILVFAYWFFSITAGKSHSPQLLTGAAGLSFFLVSIEYQYKAGKLSLFRAMKDRKEGWIFPNSLMFILSFILWGFFYKENKNIDPINFYWFAKTYISALICMHASRVVTSMARQSHNGKPSSMTFTLIYIILIPVLFFILNIAQAIMQRAASTT